MSRTDERMPRTGGLGPLLCWGVVFADLGSSVYYVPGILFGIPGVGPRAAFFVLLVAAACALLAFKYAEITARYPCGGGVVSVASHAFGPYTGCLGGILIVTDYFLTAAIGVMAGALSFASAWGVRSDSLSLACFALLALGALNLLGIRASVIVTASMAALGLASQMILLLVVAAGSTSADWTAVISQLGATDGMTGRQFLVGFGSAWLAFSGIESLSQISPSVRRPRKKVALYAMALAFGSVVATAPLLTALSTVVVARHRAVMPAPDAFIPALAALFGGNSLRVLVELSMSAMLLFSANAAILGCYHVFSSLVQRGFLPSALSARTRLFSTAPYGIALATLTPLVILLLTRGSLEKLGGLYAFGLLGAFTLSSAGLDVVRWSEGQRGVAFWFGVLTTMSVYVAWLANLYSKPFATAFGCAITLVSMMAVIATRRSAGRQGEACVPKVDFLVHATILRLGRMFEALLDYVRSWSIRPAEAAGIYRNLAARYLRKGQADNAEGAFLKTVEMAPDDAQAHVQLATLLLRDQRLEEAKGLLETAVALDEGFAPAHFQLAICLVMLGREGDAMDSFKKAATLAPQDTRVAYRMGLTLGRLGHFEEAVTTLRRAVELAPGEERLHRALALMLDSAGRQREALGALRTAMTLSLHGE